MILLVCSFIVFFYIYLFIYLSIYLSIYYIYVIYTLVFKNVDVSEIYITTYTFCLLIKEVMHKVKAYFQIKVATPFVAVDLSRISFCIFEYLINLKKKKT